MNNNKLIILIVVAVLVVVCIVGAFWWGMQKKQQEEQIEGYLNKVDELYKDFDFEGIEECYDALDTLEYDVSKQREILEYDRKVYEDAYAYYVAINNVNDKLHTGGYSSLRNLIDTMKTPTRNFEALEINTDSEIGKYIGGVKSNIMYETFNSEYVNSTKYNLDYGLTSWGYAYVIETYTEQIAKEESVFDTK
ncbi:MAG: cbb3-type cytochrome oxidase assembly protein CcoS [Lachnospiraceae bacterium]|nr:cbb3-type cytochrome oxidase assembly protein CcoS [Lachnospiraceae bacterium]